MDLSSVNWTMWQTALTGAQTAILLGTAFVVWRQLAAQLKSVQAQEKAVTAQAESTAIQTKSLQAQTAMRLDDIWDSPEKRKERARVARKADPDKLDFGLTFEELDIADFLEAVGTYLKTEAIDAQYIDQLFGYYIQGYWTILSPTIEKYRQHGEESDPDTYRRFEDANNIINKGRKFSAKTLRSDFLRMESVVAEETAAAHLIGWLRKLVS